MIGKGWGNASERAGEIVVSGQARRACGGLGIKTEEVGAGSPSLRAWELELGQAVSEAGFPQPASQAGRKEMVYQRALGLSPMEPPASMPSLKPPSAICQYPDGAWEAGQGQPVGPGETRTWRIQLGPASHVPDAFETWPGQDTSGGMNCGLRAEGMI